MPYTAAQIRANKKWIAKNRDYVRQVKRIDAAKYYAANPELCKKRRMDCYYWKRIQMTFLNILLPDDY